ncbi:hypothetical protein O0I10_005124 [Lichtheimia ornata]|uniref:Uncharacterized protein n=1 Tax=Lichtheimia ornata TaxID=688661 RepID=A0AAD7V5X0_9FUNG|nr:uncharacterized protein O0I10_005124 [Lichtheimia ornata]KAJ8659086.1 hypothetical protein O0I10_005124 [Lichtheimia ornata]
MLEGKSCTFGHYPCQQVALMVMDRIISLKLPVEVMERDVLLDMLNQLWSLKVLLFHSISVINTLREEHINVMERLALGEYTEIPIDLRTTMNARYQYLVVRNIEEDD